MRLLPTITATALGLFTTLALAKPDDDKDHTKPATPNLYTLAPNIRYMMRGKPCKDANEDEQKCATYPEPKYINGKPNYVVVCKGKEWQMVEECEGHQPCIETGSKKPACANDFDPEVDECPKGKVCMDGSGNWFQGFWGRMNESMVQMPTEVL